MSKAVYCPSHPSHTDIPPCTPAGCTYLAEARMLQDRLEAIEMLVEEARVGMLTESDGLGGLSLTACLEAARVLARSITYDDELKGKNAFMPDGRLLWVVLKQKPRPESERPRRTGRARPTRLVSLPAPAVANQAASDRAS